MGNISGFSSPLKDVSAPVIVTTDGEQKVHAEAIVQTPDSVSNVIVTGDVDPDASQVGTHTLSGARIVNDGHRVADNPSREESISSVTNHIIDGDVASGATDRGGTHTLNGDHILGDGDRVEDGPSREEAIESVTEHSVSGDIASNATDHGALQSPSLPVKVESGSVGPDAVYASIQNRNYKRAAIPTVSDYGDQVINADYFYASYEVYGSEIDELLDSSRVYVKVQFDGSGCESISNTTNLTSVTLSNLPSWMDTGTFGDEDGPMHHYQSTGSWDLIVHNSCGGAKDFWVMVQADFYELTGQW